MGGPDFHPVAKQAAIIQQWLGNGFDFSTHEDRGIFDNLPETDLLVLMGLFYSQTNEARPGSYAPLESAHEAALEAYVASGKPVLLHHGAIASYDDSEVFTRLIGINWIWKGAVRTSHSPIANYTVVAPPSAHPVMRGVGDFTLFDELYYNLHFQPGFEPTAHAWADFEGRQLPMVFTAEGGRTEGSGKLVYLANGHDLRAFECPALRQLWVNAVNWLLPQPATCQ